MATLCKQIDQVYQCELISVGTFEKLEELIVRFCQKHIASIMGNREFATLVLVHPDLATEIMSYSSERGLSP